MVQEYAFSPRAKKRLIRIVLVCAVLYLGFQGLMERYAPSRQLNFRLDVTFEVDGEQVTGSGVQTFKVSRVVGLSQRTWNHRIYGEAIIVDLPNRPSVFVLMNLPRKDGSIASGSGGYNFLIQDVCRLRDKTQDLGPAGYVRFAGNLTGSCQVPRRYIPLMVAFENEQEPTSVKQVFPENPESTLGEGVRFLGAEITITNEPMTNGIRHRLNWLSNYSEPSLGDRSTRMKRKFLSALRHGHFRRVGK